MRRVIALFTTIILHCLFWWGPTTNYKRSVTFILRHVLYTRYKLIALECSSFKISHIIAGSAKCLKENKVNATREN